MMDLDSDEPEKKRIGGIQLNKNLKQNRHWLPIIWAKEKFISVNIFLKGFIQLFQDLNYSWKWDKLAI